jgi:DNA mismatch repair protein MutS
VCSSDLLTKRGTKSKVPLAGIPYHALNPYLKKLINAGKTVTIIEQMEDPKLAKGRIVKRDVVRTITPGTIFEDDFLDSKTNNYLLSIFKSNIIGLSFVDVSTGEFFVLETDLENIYSDLAKINPAEIIYPDSFDESLIESLKRISNATFNEQPFIYYNYDFGQEKIKEIFNILSLNSFGLENKFEIVSSIGALLQYLEYTQKAKSKHFKKIKFFEKEKYLSLDIHTIKNLELIKNYDSENKNTLLSILDFTKTSMGSRLLKKNILSPLKSKDDIEYRQNFVEKIINNNLNYNLDDYLRNICDLERLASKINYNSANPRDLIALKQTIFQLIPLRDFLIENLSDLSYDLSTELIRFAELINLAINEDFVGNYKEGNFIKKGFSNELDELLNIKQNTKQILLDLETSEREKTGVKTLKIGYNKIFGFFFEVPKSQAENLPNYFVRKQTLANNERLITEDLKNLENKILGSEEKARILELELFLKLIEESKIILEEVYSLAKNIAEIDFYNSLAFCALKNNYCKPKLIAENKIFIKNGRHPILEQIIKEKFIPNDLLLNNAENTLIITGANMAGKSSYLRQNALIILMAQIGSYIPAEYAEINPVDKIFTRIGASDNLALGLSTFMVEMIETANILNNASENSFIILDEIGRGTSTYDGISIAWSVLEYIHNKISAKTLFATHYHELTQLENEFKGIKNYNFSAKEIDNQIVFLRKIEKGSINKSFGIEVANLAGLPKSVIEKAKEIEKKLETKFISKETIQKTLF